MKFTAIIQETITRNIRVIINAESKGQAKRLATALTNHDRYKEGIVSSRSVLVRPVYESIELLTAETNQHIQRELRS